MFRALLDRLSAQLPSSCHVCGSFGPASLCESCVAAHSEPRLRCHTCALPLPDSTGQVQAHARCGTCLAYGSALDACHAAVQYSYPWSGLLARFKYGGIDSQDLKAQPSLAQPLAGSLRLAAQSDNALSQALRQAERSDWIIPIPLHPSRQQERGFNHAQLLAQALFPRHSRLDTGLLLRIKATAIQASLPRAERLSNLKNAFAVQPLRTSELAGRSITLIDDVCTTTATLSSAAHVLRQAGASQVSAVVLARASFD
jgi:ComF family protein